MLQSFSQPVPPGGGGDERMTRMIGAVPWGEMMIVGVVVLGRGVIIITGPLCQSGSGNLWVSGWGGLGGRGPIWCPKPAQDFRQTEWGSASQSAQPLGWWGGGPNGTNSISSFTCLFIQRIGIRRMFTLNPNFSYVYTGFVIIFLSLHLQAPPPPLPPL